MLIVLSKLKKRLLISHAQAESFVVNFSVFYASFLVISLFSLVIFIFVRGAGYFFPQQIVELHYHTDNRATQTERQQQVVYAINDASYIRDGEQLHLFRVVTRERPYAHELTLNEKTIHTMTPVNGDVAQVVLASGAIVLGKLAELHDEHGQVALSELARLQRVKQQIANELESIRTGQMATIHEQLAQLDRQQVSPDAPARIKLQTEFWELQAITDQLTQQRDSARLTLRLADDSMTDILLHQIAQISYPNSLTWWQKMSQIGSNILQFVSDSPKQAGTAGGVFPAIFGTILMVLLMTVIVAPVGVFTAVYLNEYAPDNWFTISMRIGINNMAGIPAIVYGVFGLGFFVYMLGGNLDQIFFASTLPTPTMGAPGLFWAALTMAILTLPVVIVATEEGLKRVPQSLRAASYALGATKAETLFGVVLPSASPGIMTGVILAIARAAGEVAPLMMVGAVAFAPALPIDGEFPFIHLDRQFMHLGVLIYDGAFHSQTNANASSMMFAACLLLLFITISLNAFAVWMRRQLRIRYARNEEY